MIFTNKNQRLLYLFPRKRSRFRPKTKEAPSWERLLHKEGVTLSAFRLQGFVEIDNKVYEAETKRSCLPKGSRVKVTGESFGSLVVEPIDT